MRLLYVHRRDWYLAVEDRRDVIEQPIAADLDVSGWELRKALRLLRKSTPLLACRWIDRQLGQVPMLFAQLVEDVLGRFGPKLVKMWPDGDRAED